MTSRTIPHRSSRNGQRFHDVLVSAFAGWLAVTALVHLTQQPVSAAELRNGVVIGGRTRVYHLDPQQLLAPCAGQRLRLDPAASWRSKSMRRSLTCSVTPLMPTVSSSRTIPPKHGRVCCGGCSC